MNDVNWGDPIFKWGDGLMCSRKASKKKHAGTILIIASCHGRGIFNYLDNHTNVTDEWNIARYDTTHHVLIMNEKRVSTLDNREVRALFKSADVVFTYNLGPRHGDMRLDNLREMFSPSVRIYTFVAPNFSCLWPVSLGYSGGLGVVDAMHRGESPLDIWTSLKGGTFSPLFHLRYRLEMGRLQDRAAFHDVSFHEFLGRHLREVKLFMGNNHPSFVLTAYLGAKLLECIGYPPVPDEEIIALGPESWSMEPMPETDYEFSFYGFNYQMKYKDYGGGYDWYKDIVFRWATESKRLGLEDMGI